MGPTVLDKIWKHKLTDEILVKRKKKHFENKDRDNPAMLHHVCV